MTVDIPHDAPVSQQVDTYSLQLIARMLGGPLLYNQFFSSPFASPAFQAAIVTAQGVLTANGAALLLGPSLQSNNTALVNSVSQTILDNLVTSTQIVERISIGPATIFIGDINNGGTAFDVLAGTTNIDEQTQTFNDRFTTTTTTNTFLTTQSYELVGVTAPAAIPEPASFTLLAIGLTALLLLVGRTPRSAADPLVGSVRRS